MTCIAGIVEGDKIWMGSDSAGVGDLDLRIRVDDKIFIRDKFIFGYCGSFRMGQLLRFSMEVPCNDVYLASEDKMIKLKDDYEFMCTNFIEEVRTTFKEGGYSKIEHNEDTGGDFLVGYNGNLYSIESDFQVGMVKENYNSVGCGAPFALGALKIMEKNKKLKPEERILNSLEVAQEFSAGVRGPFKIISL